MEHPARKPLFLRPKSVPLDFGLNGTDQAFRPFFGESENAALQKTEIGPPGVLARSAPESTTGGHAALQKSEIEAPQKAENPT